LDQAPESELGAWHKRLYKGSGLSNL